jgi:pimeloyl-ACP methyl ester carboxylesterase
MVEFTLDTEHPVNIPCGDDNLEGILHIPKNVRGMILFAHGSGSSRFSTRNQHVAAILQNAKFATLLFDLLTPEEEAADVHTRIYRFDISFLADRLTGATHWVTHNPLLKTLPYGFFGASTGGGAALVAAARLATDVKAVVSRGGRPDLAGESLKYVEAPTLLIVGGLDEAVIKMNETAMQQMHSVTDLKIVPGASHLFEEPGKLDVVAKLAKEWFEEYLA